MRTCDGFLLVVDLTNKKTLDGLEAFRTQIMRSKDTNNPLIFIAANKCDLPDSDKAVTKDDLETIKKKWNNVGYLETSAKERKNVDEAFMKVIEMVLTKRKPSTTVKKKEKKCLIL
jgi:GTPase SAR1 family protein